MDELELNLLKFIVADDPRASQILTTLANSGPEGAARAEQLSQRLAQRQQLQTLPGKLATGLGKFLTSMNITRSPQDQARREQVSQASAARRDSRGDTPIQGVPESLNNFLEATSQTVGPTLGQIASFPIDRARDIAALPGQLDELFDPIGNAERDLAALRQAEVTGTLPDTLQPNAANVGPTGPAQLPSIATTPAQLPYQFEGDITGYAQEQTALTQGFQQAQQQQQALLLNQAYQQGAQLAERERLTRLAEQIALQQTPQVGNTLNAAAAGAQTPAITANPANVNQTLALTQSLAPQIQVPDLQRAATTNLRQQNRADRINQSAQDAVDKQRMRALELAMRQFQMNIARPILSERR